MDMATVIGLTMTYIFLLSAMALGVGIGPYIDIPSVLIVVGGSIGALFIGFTMDHMKKM